jgi:hypothetical protein
MDICSFIMLSLGVFALYQIEKRLEELVDQFRIED